MPVDLFSNFFSCSLVFIMLLMSNTRAPNLLSLQLVFFSGNGHAYQLIPGPVDFALARDMAANKFDHNYKGAKGHLATITSQEEDDFISSNIVKTEQVGTWISLRSHGDDGKLVWQDGPEAGIASWFHNFESGSPTQSADLCVVLAYGPSHTSWNEVSCVDAIGDILVEFECPPGQMFGPTSCIGLNHASIYSFVFD